jgi:hypothetical protein
MLRRDGFRCSCGALAVEDEAVRVNDDRNEDAVGGDVGFERGVRGLDQHREQARERVSTSGLFARRPSTA